MKNLELLPQLKDKNVWIEKIKQVYNFVDSYKVEELLHQCSETELKSLLLLEKRIRVLEECHFETKADLLLEYKEGLLDILQPHLVLILEHPDDKKYQENKRFLDLFYQRILNFNKDETKSISEKLFLNERIQARYGMDLDNTFPEQILASPIFKNRNNLNYFKKLVTKVREIFGSTNWEGGEIMEIRILGNPDILKLNFSVKYETDKEFKIKQQQLEAWNEIHNNASVRALIVFNYINHNKNKIKLMISQI